VSLLRVELDGRAADPAILQELAFAGYGHFTSMQVRGHRVRGLDLHLERLERDSRELFGRPVETGVLVRVGPPVVAATSPVRVRTTVHERLLPQVKHVATLGLVCHWRRVRQDGFDDVLFVDRDGFVSEGSIWNICFSDGDQVVWPAAPALCGITMQLVQTGLRREGVPSATRPIHKEDVPGFRSAVLMNSIVAGRPVVGIDGAGFPDGGDLLATVRRCYETNEGQPLR
jgi:branched-subunit amino acid aminotransferase/4-amino-4-deoxychorismate lyase